MGRNRSLLLMIVVLMAQGCAGTGIPGVVEPPQVEVKNVALDTSQPTALFGARGLDGRVDLSLFNPNNFSLPIQGMDWGLSVGGSHAVQGHANLAETIAAKAATPVQTAIHLDPTDALDIARRLAAGARDYRLDGTMKFATSFGTLPVPFSHTGSLSSLAGPLSSHR